MEQPCLLILTAVGGGGTAGVGRGVGCGVAVARAADVGVADVEYAGVAEAVEVALDCAVDDGDADETDGAAAPLHPTRMTPSNATAAVMRNPLPPRSRDRARPDLAS